MLFKLNLMIEVRPHISKIKKCLTTPLCILCVLIAHIVGELTIVIKRGLNDNIQHASELCGFIMVSFFYYCIIGHHMISSLFLSALLACGCVELKTERELRDI